MGLLRRKVAYNQKAEKESVKLSIIEYNADTFVEKENVTVQECIEHLKTPTITWIQVYGTHDPKMITDLANHFNIHPLALEDILSNRQRPSLEVYENQILATARILFHNEKKELRDRQVSIVFGVNYLITFSENSKDFFKPIREMMKQSYSRIRQNGADFLAYSILDLVVDQYFTILEEIDIELEKLENEIIKAPQPNVLMKIQHARKEVIFVRNSAWPTRDLINRFQHLDPPLVNPTTQIYLRDVYDHLIQIIDIIEEFRDVVSSMIDVYLSNINIRTNEIIRILTIITTIFIPLTFVTSIYGMNFEFMPELQSPLGYPTIMLVMAGIAGVMLYYFHRKNWL